MYQFFISAIEAVRGDDEKVDGHHERVSVQDDIHESLKRPCGSHWETESQSHRFQGKARQRERRETIPGLGEMKYRSMTTWLECGAMCHRRERSLSRCGTESCIQVAEVYISRTCTTVSEYGLEMLMCGE